MSFLNQLGKDFVRSAVRQVGRDGGRVISNQIYNGKHGTPVYRSNNNQFLIDKEIDDIDWVIQPKIKGGGFLVFIQGFLVQFIPLMTIYVIVKAVYYLNKKNEYIYQSGYITQSDRRYKMGYKLAGTSVQRSIYKRNLSESEIKKSKERGLCYLLSLILFFAFNFILYLNSPTK